MKLTKPELKVNGKNANIDGVSWVGDDNRQRVSHINCYIEGDYYTLFAPFGDEEKWSDAKNNSYTVELEGMIKHVEE